MTNTRKYEAFYIVGGGHSDAQVETIINKFKTVVEGQGGTVESAAKWDKRKLAYEIAGQKEGNYILMHFTAEAQVPSELKRQFRIDEQVIRHMILSIEG